ncbi:MAG: twin-arginine translocase subunit TatC, partial [Longimicrobiales bacterium]
LEDHEKRAIIPALYLGLLLFCAGVALAYFVALPVSIVFFQTFEGGLMEAQYEIGKTLALITKILLGFGIIFELPVVVMILSALGLVTPEFLRSKRRHAIVAITIAASFLTPGDVITLTVMLMVPLFFLYEFSIYLSRLIWRRKRARERAEEADGDGDGDPEPPPTKDGGGPGSSGPGEGGPPEGGPDPGREGETSPGLVGVPGAGPAPVPGSPTERDSGGRAEEAGDSNQAADDARLGPEGRSPGPEPRSGPESKPEPEPEPESKSGEGG